jgi:hypothetical protein
MRKLMIGLLSAAALGLSTAANAQVSVDNKNLDVVIPEDHGDTFSIGFLELGGDSPFDHFITFTEALAGTYGFTLTTTATTNSTGGIAAATDVDFTSAWLEDDMGNLIANLLADPDNTDVNEDYGLAGLFLNAGTYTLHITGTRGENSQYTGGIAFAAVPEPATWAMLLLGFGAVGFTMRRRRRPALVQIA